MCMIEGTGVHWLVIVDYSMIRGVYWCIEFINATPNPIIPHEKHVSVSPNSQLWSAMTRRHKTKGKIYGNIQTPAQILFFAIWSKSDLSDSPFKLHIKCDQIRSVCSFFHFLIHTGCYGIPMDHAQKGEKQGRTSFHSQMVRSHSTRLQLTRKRWWTA